jgi:hypothetical protein
MGPERLTDFLGRWRLTRRIDDARAVVEGRFAGVAEFRAAGTGLLCEERGRLTYAGQPPLEAFRTYLWRQDGAGRIAVDHADGRPFHSFALGAVAEADHTCAPDFYRVRYDFADWPRWRATWRVSGPRKDYVSITDYARDDGSG